MTQAAGAPEICINLYKDWIELLRERLEARGYAVDSGADPQDIAIRAFNVDLREIEPRPRAISRAVDFAVPAEYGPAIAEIERKAMLGEPLRPHLSKTLLRADFHDALLNDWGIHHLHLGTELAADGFVKRSGPLLFVLVTADTLHLISVQAHGTWSDKALLEQVLKTWPSLLIPFECPGVTGADPDFSASTRGKLREKRGLMLTELSNGKVYAPPGGGYTASGANLGIVLHHDRWARFLELIEEDLRATIEAKRGALPDGAQFGSPPTFRLMLDNGDGDPVAVELNSKQGYLYPRPPMLVRNPAA